MKKYNLILADPPWAYNDKLDPTRTLKYPTLTIEDIKELNVQSISDDNCMLALWCTWPQLKEGLDVIDSWGFEYKTCLFVWAKKNKIKDSWFWGMGRHSRANTEFVLLGTKGSVPRQSAAIHQLVVAPVAKHSAKPPEVREKLVDLYGDVSRVELFARDHCAGWDAIGNEIDCKDIRDVLGKRV